MQKLEKIKKLGNGNFGDVILVKSKIDSKLYALKRVGLGDSSDTSIPPSNEVNVLQALEHPNIIKYYDSFIWKNKFCILMEFASDGDLSQKLKEMKQEKKHFEEEKVVEWTIQICKSIKYLHEQKIIHRDIKLQNIFLTEEGTIKLGDFGISKKLEFTGQFAKTSLGTPYYLSPEICQSEIYDYMTDIWMLGCAIYELCTLEKPFMGESWNIVINKILKDNPPPIPSSYSSFLRDLVLKMFNKNPSFRPSISEILEALTKKYGPFESVIENRKKANIFESEDVSNLSLISSKSQSFSKFSSSSKIASKSIHSIIQARKDSISPTNNPFFQIKEEDLKESKDDNLSITETNLSFTPEESFSKKPYQRQISINTAGLDHYHKKSTPLSKESSNSNSTKNNIPTDKVRKKTFSFADTIFDPKSPNSPTRSILFSDFLLKRLGEPKYIRMKNLLENKSNPLKFMDDNRSLVGEIIGEENMDCLKIFKFLISSVVTPQNEDGKKELFESKTEKN